MHGTSTGLLLKPNQGEADYYSNQTKAKPIVTKNIEMKIECLGHSVWGLGTPSSQKGVVGVAHGANPNNVRPLYPELFPTVILVFCISFGYITYIDKQVDASPR